MLKTILAAAILALPAAPAPAQGPLGPIPVAGAKSQVLTLASVHLSGHEKWTPAMLEPLLAKLAAFRPQVITQEGLSGEQCDHLKQHPDLYGEVYGDYCWDPDEILATTRLSVPQAMLKVRETLKAWPASPTSAERRRLALMFLAAGDRASARVQWLRLSAADRNAADGITEKMIEIIERKGKKMNESYEVAAVLAARLGLERVEAVDDHSSDGALADVGPEYGEELTARYKDPALLRLRAEYEAAVAKVVDGASLLDYFRAMNARDGVRSQILGDFGGAAALSTPQLSGRKYLGWWEVRNLRMVANARAAFTARPGVRVLNVVGASHKPWYDHLFATMPDVEVVDAARVLR